MADNVTTQSTTPATPPASTVIATVEATHSGDTVQAGVGVLAKSTGAEGSRVLTIINPATEDKQDSGNTSLSSIDGKLPALVSSRVPVDGSGVTQPVKDAAATSATLSNVASSATNVTLLASNASRRGATFYNDSTQNAYVKLGATASATSFSYLLVPGQTLELPAPIYTGVVEGLWASANGSMRVTEIA